MQEPKTDLFEAPSNRIARHLNPENEVFESESATTTDDIDIQTWIADNSPKTATATEAVVQPSKKGSFLRFRRLSFRFRVVGHPLDRDICRLRQRTGTSEALSVSRK